MADANLIGSDAPCSDAQRAIARAVTDLIIPASADGVMPSAADFDVIGYVARNRQDRLAAILGDLDALEDAARETHAKPFNELDREQQSALTDAARALNGEFLSELAVSTTIFYYQQDKVLEALGMEARPPYPQGHSVKSGDLSLLDPVRERGPIFREIEPEK